ncbi:MAG: hypothetical protein JWQ81_8365 [Amycolatopsis sp.]|uniref:DUF397 domain-containing protein n=1 Tax=Amycolatopsis sp. TaxID=37632 RepID=UPI0026362488|nr:DUF397 domain-containing protein [Amycolatopsis sp.]MCU1687626.1 hypothetical protein [Amycolatopsis sp.]
MPNPDFADALWIKSSRSADQGQCVELATVDGWIGVRDSKLGADGPVLALTATTMRAFLSALA